MNVGPPNAPQAAAVFDLELAGSPVRVRRAPWGEGEAPENEPPGPPCPVLLHGMPGDGGDWSVLLEHTGGLAPDLPGFGASGKGGHLDLSPVGMSAFVERLAMQFSLARLQLVAHGHACPAALTLAARRPELIERVVLCSPPSPPGSAATPRLERVLRRPVLGELLIGSVNRRLLGRWLQRGGGAAAPDRLAELWSAFDHGTQRAILRVLRAGVAMPPPPPGLPVLVVCGQDDPWADPAALEALRLAAPEARLVAVPGTGHWPWLTPAGAAEIAHFLAEGGSGPPA